MTVDSSEPTDFRSLSASSVEHTSARAATSRSRWQVGLRTLLLLMAAAGVWFAYIANRREIPRVQSRIDVLQPLVRELKIDDLSQIAVVLLEPQWYNEFRWRIYLPEGKYRLCLATRQVAQEGFPSSFVHASIPAGQHLLELKHILKPPLESKEGRISIWLNDKELIGVDEKPDWHTHNSSIGGSQISTCQQFPLSKPVTLFRRQRATSGKDGASYSPKAICDGILVWIEPLP